MSTGVTQLSVEYCHFTIAPVCPDKVSRVLLVPLQTAALPAIDPPTEATLTRIWASAELVEEQTPLVITALYFVELVRLVAV